MTKINLQGQYVKQTDGFYSVDFPHRLVLSKRTANNRKPIDFLIIKPCCGSDTLPDGSKDKYVSSLFWTATNTARIDFQGFRYVVSFTDDHLSIDPLTTNGKVL